MLKIFIALWNIFIAVWKIEIGVFQVNRDDIKNSYTKFI